MHAGIIYYCKKLMMLITKIFYLFLHVELNILLIISSFHVWNPSALDKFSLPRRIVMEKFHSFLFDLLLRVELHRGSTDCTDYTDCTDCFTIYCNIRIRYLKFCHYQMLFSRVIARE